MTMYTYICDKIKRSESELEKNINSVFMVIVCLNFREPNHFENTIKIRDIAILVMVNTLNDNYWLYLNSEFRLILLDHITYRYS